MKKINFTAIDKNARNMNGTGRDKSKDATYIIAVTGGKAGLVRIDKASEPVVMETGDTALSALEMLANLLTNRAAAEDNAPTTVYVTNDAHIRAKAAFGAVKNGTDVISERAMEYISKFRSEELTNRYVAAANKMVEAIQTARENGKMMIVRAIDDFKFTMVDGIAGVDANQTFLLSGQEVAFEAMEGNKSVGIAKVAKGTIIGKNTKITLSKDVYLRAPYTYGVHKLSVANIGGDRRNRKLVALINDEQHPELKKARDAYFSLLNVMNPKAAAAEAEDIAFENIESGNEIPA